MILSATWRGSFYVCLTEPPDFSHGEHQNINTQDYCYSGNLGLTFKYCKEYNLNKILYNYQQKAIFGKYIILFDTLGYVKFDKKLCNSVEESLKYLKDKKECEKDITNECDDIPF